MDEKRNAVLTAGLLCAVLLAFAAADFLKTDRIYSETENRMLASRPEISWETIKSGEFTEDYEAYITDQFVGRDKWIGIKTQADILSQKKSVNGVYLGKDGYLLEQHLPEAFTAATEVKKLALLEKLVADWDAKVMLVPTADNVLTDKLPANAPYYDQGVFLEKVKDGVGEEYFVDVYGALKAHKDEEIFYRTDHHWTSLGAFYGYRAWAENKGVIEKEYGTEGKCTVTEDFLGTLHSKVNLAMEGEEIFYFPETEARPVSITYDRSRKADSFYEQSYLETKNKYGFFLDDNHAFVEIDTDYHNGRTLFVIKDSFANSLVPLLASHYSRVYVVDLRYYNGSLYDLMEAYKPDRGMDVLVVYNVIHFLEDFRYYE